VIKNLHLKNVNWLFYVFITGHRHYYFRTYPILYDGVLDPRQYDKPLGIFHLTVGGPGNDEMQDIKRMRRELEQFEEDKARGMEKPDDPSPADSTEGGRAERQRESRMHLTKEMLAKVTDYVRDGLHVDTAIAKAINTVHGSGSSTGGNVADTSTWTAANDKDNHVGISKITVNGGESLEIQYIRTKDGSVYDTITLTKDNSIYPLKDCTDFECCVSRGGRVRESYPEQCVDPLSGASFMSSKL